MTGRMINSAAKHSLLLGVIGYAVIIFFLFFPVLFPSKGMLLFGDDIHRSYHFFRMFEYKEMQKGTIPWWNPYQFGGEPFVANPSVTFWYPPNWLYLFIDYRLVYSWIAPAHIILAMSTMLWLCKRRLSFLSSWFAGLIFGLSGFFMARLWAGHIDILTSAPYMPLVFGLSWYAIENPSRKRVVLAGASYALQIFAGYQTVAYFTGWAIGFLGCVYALKQKSVRPLGVIFGLAFIAAGLAGLQILPSQEFFARSIRTYAMPYSWVTLGSYTWQSFKQLVFPFIFGTPDNYSGASPNYAELSNYIGVIPLVLAIFAICYFVWKKIKSLRSGLTDRDMFIVVGILLVCFSLWVSLAKNAPIDLQYILWKIIPLYKYLRIPSRHLLLFVFGASILSAVGLEVIKKVQVRVLLIGLTIIDLMIFAQHFIELRPDPAVRHNPTLVSYLQKNIDLNRLLPNFNVGMGTRDAFDFDAPMSYQIFSATGYDPAILRNYYDFIVAAIGVKTYDVQQSDVQIPYLNTDSPYLDFLNIKYLFVPTWFDYVGSDSKYRVVLSETKKDYWRLYENTHVLPRFFLVPHLITYKDKNEVINAITERSADLAHSLLAVRTPGVPTGSDCLPNMVGTADVIAYESNMISLKLHSPCHMYLSTSEVYYPGWHAYIDSKEAPIFESNIAFKGVAVPPGDHVLKLVYVPTIFVLGAGVSSIFLLGCLVVVRGRRLRL